MIFSFLLIIFHFSFAYFTKAQVNNYIFMEHKKHRALSVLNLISFSLHLFKTLLTKTIIIGNLLDLLYFILCFWFFSQFKSVYECFILLLLFFCSQMKQKCFIYFRTLSLVLETKTKTIYVNLNKCQFSLSRAHTRRKCNFLLEIYFSLCIRFRSHDILSNRVCVFV